MVSTKKKIIISETTPMQKILIEKKLYDALKPFFKTDIKPEDIGLIWDVLENVRIYEDKAGLSKEVSLQKLVNALASIGSDTLRVQFDPYGDWIPDIDGRFLGETTTPKRWDGSKLINLPQPDFQPLLYELTIGRYFASLSAVKGWGGQYIIPDIIFAHVFPLPRKMRFDRIGTTAGGGEAGSKARVGVYNSDGNGKPNALLVDSGELTIEGWGMKQTTIDLTLDKGLYFIAFLCNTYSAVIDACGYFLSPIGNESDFDTTGRWERTFTYAGLPDPFGTPNTSWIGVEILANGLRLAELL